MLVIDMLKYAVAIEAGIKIPAEHMAVIRDEWENRCPTCTHTDECPLYYAIRNRLHWAPGVAARDVVPVAVAA